MDYAVLLSGGVDSSVALHTVQQRGDGRVTAYYLKIWLEDEAAFLGACPWEEDLQYARAVCQRVGVPLEVVPLQAEYYDRVVSYTLDELRAGHTPSPDIFCNQRVKFGAFLEALDALGEDPDRVVTGHYAGVAPRADGTGVELLSAPDPVKDQTYFLSHLSQKQLARAEFPVGTMTKAEVRTRAAALDLETRSRPDSQGICFLGQIRYRDFVAHYLGRRQGPIVDADSGRTLGEHEGAWFYTIGQRQGLGLGNGPWYVINRDVSTNIVTVSHARDVADRARSRFSVGAVHWIAGRPEVARVSELKLRHGPERVRCAVSAAGDSLVVTMEREDRGVAPGQFAVFYDGPVCLGAGMILDNTERHRG